MKNKFNKISKLILTALMLAVMFAVPGEVLFTQADINPLYNFKGRITDSTNVPVADGIYNFSFGLFAQPTGGAAIWSETLNAANLFSATISSSVVNADNIIYTYASGVNANTLRVGQPLNSGSSTATIIDFNTGANTVTVTLAGSAWGNGANINNRPRVDGGIADINLGSVTDPSNVNFDQPLYLEITFNGETMLPRKNIVGVPQAFNAAKVGGRSATDFGSITGTTTVNGLWNFANSLSVSTSSANAALSVNQDGSGRILELKHLSADVFNVGSNGFVGIGTGTPLSMLSINGDVLMEGSNRYLSFGTASGSAGYGLRDNAGVIEFKNSGGGWSTFSSGGTINAGLAGQIGYYGANGNIISATSSLFINTGGFVGVGTTTPDEQLVVDGNIKWTGDLLAANGTQSVGSVSGRIANGYFTNLDVLNMSIASTSISGSASNIFTINSANVTNDTEDSSLAFHRGVAVPEALLTWNSTADRFEFNFPVYTGANNILTMGNVGIGTTTPSVALSVGANSGQQFLVSNSGIVSDGTWQGDLVGAAYGGTGQNSSGWTGFTFVNGGIWTATSTINQTFLPGNLLYQGNNITLLANNAGFITATSSDALANKTGNITMWTNNAGYITSSSAETLTNKSGQISMWTNDSGYLLPASITNFITASSTDALTNKSGNISMWTNNAGYITSSSAETLTNKTWQGNIVGLAYGGLATNTSAFDGLLKISGGTASSITDNSGNWNTAYGWGSHAVMGYITSSSAETLVNKTWNGSAVGAAYGGTGQNSSAWSGYAFVTGGVWSATSSIPSGSLPGNLVYQGDDISWLVNNVGYITSSSTETLTNKTWQGNIIGSTYLPVAVVYENDNITRLTNNAGYITSSSAETLTNKSGQISMWTNDSGYISSYVETDPVYSVSAAAAITAASTTNWTTAYGWGNHALAGYITDGNVGWDNAYGFITATSSETLTNKAWQGNVIGVPYGGTGTSTQFATGSIVFAGPNGVYSEDGGLTWDADYGSLNINGFVGHVAGAMNSSTPRLINNVFSIGSSDGGSFTLNDNLLASGGFYALGDLISSKNSVSMSVLNNNVSNAYGTLNDVSFVSSGSGNLNRAYGSYNNILAMTGTILNSYGVYSNVNKLSGNITNGYGVFIDSVQATNAWALYSSSTAKSYFGGNVGIGTTTPSNKLTVGATAGQQFLVNATGTVIGGTWQGSPVGQAYGGTGTSSVGWTGYAFVNSGIWSATSSLPSGALPSNLVYQGDNISWLTNNVGYITSTSAETLVNKTWNGDMIGLAYGGLATSTSAFDGFVKISGGITTYVTDNSANWNIAYGWGDHSLEGYLTSFTETDPIFVASEANNITAASTTNWTTAFGWGNHATAGYITATSSETLTNKTWNGNLIDVAYGGTGTSTAFTAGSIVFAGAGGGYNQSNANLFWDNTNKRLGLGTSSPSAMLAINGVSNNALLNIMSSTSASALYIANNGNVSIGSSSTSVSQFYVSGAGQSFKPYFIGSLLGQTDSYDVKVQGRYAYIANNNARELVIADISNPALPVEIGSIYQDEPNALLVSGKYAYVSNEGAGNNFNIVDISNPSNPINISTSSFGFNSMYIQGRYLYGGTNFGSLMVVDISNPYQPEVKGSYSSGTFAPVPSVYVQGKYAYFSSNELYIVNVENPDSITLVNTPSIPAYYFAVQGRYAYCTNWSSNALNVVDISNPAAPYTVGTSTGQTGPTAVQVQGRYAYVINGTGNALKVVDIASSSAPYTVSTLTGFNNVRSIDIQGRHAFLMNRGDNSMKIVDIGGAYLQQAEIGGLETYTLKVQSNAVISNDLTVAGGANISRGLSVYGNAGFNGKASFIGGNVGIGTTTPSEMLTVGATSSQQFLVNSIGQVTGGTWQGSPIGQAYGGTGTSSVGWTGYAFVSGGNWSATSSLPSGALPSNLVYQGDNISWLTNNVGYITSTSAETLVNKTWNGDIIGLAYGGLATNTSAFDGFVKISGGITTYITDNSANWNTAYGWGDHALEGYLTSYTETDPIFVGSEANNITAASTTNWNTAYAWGDHALAGYIVDGNTNWDNLYGLITATSSETLTNKTWNGNIIDVAYGGTGTSTAFTAGSIVFAGAGGAYSQDNNNFFWDAANGRLGLGTNNPQDLLDIYGAGRGLRLSYDSSNFVSLSSSPTGELTISNSASSTPTLVIGSGQNENAVLAFDASSTDYLMGLDTSDGVFKIGMGNTLGSSTALVINPSGFVGIGTTTPGSALSVVGDLTLDTAGRLNFNGVGGNSYLTHTAGNNSIALNVAGFVNALFQQSGTVFYRPVSFADDISVADNITIGTSTSSGLLTVGATSSQQFLVNNVGVITQGLWNGSAIGPVYGGTGITVYSTGDMIYASGANALSRLAIGGTGQVLMASSTGVPYWATQATGTGITLAGENYLSLAGSTITANPVNLGTSNITGTLGVTNGGTGTSTQFTPGSVVFAGVNGSYGQNNASLFWDAANQRLGLGTAVPGYPLDLNKTFTATSGNQILSHFKLTASPSGTSTANYTGNLNEILPTGSYNMGSLIAGYNKIDTVGMTGSSTDAYGTYNVVDRGLGGIANMYGNYNYLYNSNSGGQNGANNMYGQYNYVYSSNSFRTAGLIAGTYNNPTTNTGNATDVVGTYNLPFVNGGTVINTYGSYNSPFVISSTATNAYGSYNGITRVGGTLSNAYGVYIADVAGMGTRSWALYASGTASSYFGGNVGIGTTSPSNKLTVGAISGQQFMVNATGTVIGGTWQGNAIGIGYGGTGTSTAPAYGQLLLGNGAGSYNLVGTSSLGISSGIGSLNGLLGSTQLFNVGSTGNDFNIVSTGTTHTLNLPTASGANRGLLASADYTTFSNAVTTANNLQTVANATKAPTGWPNLASTSISFATSTRTFSISPTGADFDFYIDGVRFMKNSTQQVVITDTEGVWFIYFDNTGTLTASQSAWNLSINSPIALVYWDATNDKNLLLAEERHGITMDWATHEYLHRTVGTRYAGGLAISGYTTSGTGDANGDAQISLTGGTIFDEDLKIDITHSSSPVNRFEQNLTPTSSIPVYYRSGASAWRKKDADFYPALYGSARLTYNLNTAGDWTTPDAVNTNYVAVWIFATDNINEPIVAVLGQSEDTSLTDAKTNNTYQNMQFGTLPFQEMKVLYRLIYQTGNAYANAVHARLRDVQDLRSVTSLPGNAFVATDHGSLSGLLNDDHVQYALLGGRTGGQTLYGGLNAGETLTLESTANATKGSLLLNPYGGYVGIGTTTPSAMLTVGATTSQQFLVNSLGVITDGTWQGDVIGIAYGGTGTTTAPTLGQLLMGNGAGGYNLVSTSSLGLVGGSVVSSLTGTAAQVIVSASSGAVTLSLPQNIANTSNPTFAGLTLSGLTSGSLLFAAGGGLISQDNANFFYDSANHRLGLGTTNPQESLDIFGAGKGLRLSYDGSNYVGLASNASGELMITSSATSTDSAVIIGNGLNQNTLMIFDASTTDYTVGIDASDNKFKVGLGQLMGSFTLLTIDASGKIGIGTTTPSAMLTVGATSSQQLLVNSLGVITDGTWQGDAIGVAYGGTGTSTAFTAGSIVFAGTGGVYGQNNANLFWDNTNTRLGIGSSTPVGKVAIVGNAAGGTTGASASSTLIVIGGAGGTGSGVNGGTGGLISLTGGAGGAGGGGGNGGTGGQVFLNGGNGGNGGSLGNGGDVVLNGGAKTGAGTDGNIILASLRGRVGIGTTTPSNLLTVGATSSQQFLVNSFGVIIGGAWNGSVIGIAYGGTGTTTAPTLGQLLMGNGAGGYNLVSTSSLGLVGGSVVSSLAGTAAQVIVSASSGAVTLSLPQSIANTSNPTFAGLTLSGLTSGSLLFAAGGGLISQDNANFFYDSANHRLGLGTSLPGDTLDIFGPGKGLRLSYDNSNFVTMSSNANGELNISSSASTTGSGVTIGNGLAKDAILMFDASTTDYHLGVDATDGLFKIGTGNALGSNNHLTVDNAGHIGIGTTTPLAKLHIVSSEGLTPAFDGNEVAIFQRNGTTTDVAGLDIIAGENAEAYIEFGDRDSSDNGWVAYDTSVNALHLATGGQNRLTINSEGHLVLTSGTEGYIADFGDGTQKISMFTDDGFGSIGMSTLGHDLRLFVDNDSTLGMTIKSGGNVGIGTTTPNAMLTVGATSGQQLLVSSLGVITDGTWQGDVIGIAYGGTGTTTAPTLGQLLMGNGAGGYDLVSTSSLGVGGGGSGTVNSGTAGQLAYYGADGAAVSGSGLIWDNGNGSLGIGTATPAALLNVYGSSQQLRLSYDNSTYSGMSVDASGNLSVQSTGGYLKLNAAGIQNYLQIFDSTGLNYIQLTHNGTNGLITTNTGNIELGSAGDLTLGNGVNIVGEGDFDIKGSASTSVITLGDTAKSNDDIVAIDASNWSVATSGMINASFDGVGTKVVGGVVSDGSFTNSAFNGLTAIDSSNGRIYFRYGGAWHYVNQTGGFQIPNFETAPVDELNAMALAEASSSLPFEKSNYPEYLTAKLAPGDLLIPYVDQYMADGAIHGLYARFEDVKNKMLAGAFVISKDGTVNLGSASEDLAAATTTNAEIQVVTATTSVKTAFVVNQEGAGDVADFKTQDVSVMTITDDTEVKVVGTLDINGRVLVCAGGICPADLRNNIDETMGDMGVEGKIIAGSFQGYCEDGFVWVAGSAKYGTMPGFCVMSDLAQKVGTSTVPVVANGELWNNISQGESQLACQSLGSNYHLLSENEWLTLAENISRTATNDIDKDAIGLQLATASTTYVLSNGNMIHNLAGTTTEWTDQTVLKAGLPVLSDGLNANDWQEFSSVIDYKGMSIAPAYYLTAANGIGKILTSDNPENLRGFIRGYMGIYGLDVSNAPTAAKADVGFRCAK